MSVTTETICIKPSELTSDHIDAMFKLMDDSYYGIKKESFIFDLQSKDKILILLKFEQIIGFTTFKFSEMDDPENSNNKLNICFSGDTVVDKRFRGDLNLPIQWGLIILKESILKNSSIYWLLTTKGIRTYRYLPVFFHNFYPSPVISNPRLQLLCNHFGIKLFQNDFNPSSGILARESNIQSIREVDEDIAYINRKKDPFVKYFLTKNPHFAEGNELVCIAEFSLENIKPFIKKILLNKNE